MTLSFVIPVYNRAHVIGRCLDSVFRAVPSDKIAEIVVVDDGSSDDIAAVVSRWRTAHPMNLVFVQSKRNGGVSRARNLAFPFLTGDYVWFVDSDDVVFPEGVVRMLPILDSQHPDTYRFSWCRIREEILDRPSSDCLILPEPERHDLQTATSTELKRLFGRALLCNAVFRRAILDGIRFLPGLANAEDGLFARTVLTRTGVLLSDANNIAYGYTVTTGSASAMPTDRMFRSYVRYSCEESKMLTEAAIRNRRWVPVLRSTVWSIYPRLLSSFGLEAFRDNRLAFVRVAYYRIFVANRFRRSPARFASLLVWAVGTKWAILGAYRIHIILAMLSTRSGLTRICSRVFRRRHCRSGSLSSAEQDVCSARKKSANCGTCSNADR